jgi:hypothetical protein
MQPSTSKYITRETQRQQNISSSSWIECWVSYSVRTWAQFRLLNCYVKGACFTRSAYHYKGSRYYIAAATRSPIPPQGLVPFPPLLITGLLQLLFLNFQYLGGLQSLGMHMPFTFVLWHVIQSGFRGTRRAGDPHPVFSTRSSFILCWSNTRLKRLG